MLLHAQRSHVGDMEGDRPVLIGAPHVGIAAQAIHDGRRGVAEFVVRTDADDAVSRMDGAHKGGTRRGA